MSIRKTLLQRAQPKCSDCKEETDVVHDVAQGQLVCTGCGLVLGKRVISEESEWRTFSDSSSTGADPNRVGSKSHALLENSLMSTEIGQGAGSFQLAKYQNRTAEEAQQRALLGAFREIEGFCDQLNLSYTVKAIAQEVYKQLHDVSQLKGRPRNVVITTCLYIACQSEGVPRTIKELCTQFEVRPRDVGRYYKRILKLKKDGKVKLTKKKRPGKEDLPRSARFLLRFCSDLQLPPVITNAATEVCKAVHKKVLAGGRTPATVAGAAILLITKLVDDDSLHRTSQQIAEVAHISARTVKATYRLLVKDASSIVPRDFADEKQLSRLSSEPL